MRRTLTASLALGIVLTASPATVAQSVGPLVGYELGLPLAIERAPGVVNTYDASGDGRSENHTVFAGARLDLPFGRSSFSLSPRLGVALSSGRFTSDSFSVVEAITRPSITTREFTVVSTIALLRAEALLRAGVTSRFGVVVGPWASLRLTSGFYQTERLLGPPNARYRDSSTSRVVAAGEDIGGSGLRGGLIAGLAYEIPLSAGLVSLELTGRLDAGAIADGLASRAISGGVAIAWMLPTSSSVGSVEPIASSAPGSASSSRGTSGSPADSVILSARISIGTDSQPVTLTSSATIHRLEIALPRAVRFARGEATMPADLERLTRPLALAFTEHDLTRMTPREALRRGLDLLGRRLATRPSERVRLVGGRAEGEPPSLARERAERLRAYLVEVWGVAPERVELDAADGPGVAAVAIVLASGAASEPAVVDWIERSWNAPKLTLDRTIQASAGVRSWTIDLRQGGRQVARYDDEDAAEPRRFTISGERPLRPLTAELTVEDSAGRVVVARDTAMVASTDPGEPAREHLAILLQPGDDLAGTLQSLARRVRPGAVITVQGAGGSESAKMDASRAGELLLTALRRAQAAPAQLNLRIDPPIVGSIDAIVVEIEQPTRATEVTNETRGG